MKVLLIILGVVLVAAIAVVAGCRILASRSTEATVALTAKLPGKIAVDTSDFTGGCPPPPSRSLCQSVNLELQFIKFLVILPFTFQLSLHLERGTHHAY